MASKVWYMDARSINQASSMVMKLLRVFDEANLGSMIEKGDVVCIKIHCGEWNNTGYIRPVYVRALADKIKEYGGRPFVSDSTTMPYSPYTGRITAMDLLQTAERNGFSSATMGCPFIVGDGYLGLDDVRVDVPEGNICKEAYIGAAYAHADKMIALSHFKGHTVGLIGGAVKNLGIGCQSKRGKQNIHMGGHPKYGPGATIDFHPERCTKEECERWAICSSNTVCPYGLITMTPNGPAWEREKCAGCFCHNAILIPCQVMNFAKETMEASQIAMADGAMGVLHAIGGKDRVAYINLAMDISPACDCLSFADMPLVPHVGVFASRDMIAIDQACLDLVEASETVAGSRAEDLKAGDKKFEPISGYVPGMCENMMLNSGHLIGLGSKQYDLTKIEADPNAVWYFQYDKRPAGEKFRRNFEKTSPMPYERYDGAGYNRVEEIDMEKVRNLQVK